MNIAASATIAAPHGYRFVVQFTDVSEVLG